MSENMSEFEESLSNQFVLKVFEETAKGIFGKRRQNKAKQAFISLPETETYLCSRFVDGESKMKRVFDVKDAGTLGVNNYLIQVSTKLLDTEIIYSGLTAKDDDSFDLAITALVKISEARKFLNQYGLNWAKSANIVDVTILETLLANQCKQQITDEMQTITYDALIQQDALPGYWWENKLAAWFALDWLELVDIKAVQYTSATADKAKEIKERQKISELELEGQRQIQQTEIQLQQDQQTYKSTIDDLDANRIISEQQRQAELEQAKLTFEKATIETKQEVELVKLQAQKRRVELKAEIDRINNREDLAAERLKQAESSEKRTREMLERYNTANSELDSSIHLIKDAIKEGLSDAKRISEFGGGLSSGTMELLGRSSGKAYFSRVLQEKASTDSNPIMMKKVELQSRDIGTKKVDVLKINSSLQFEFMTQRAGYATILNIGTSGTIWLQCPNVYVGIENTKVAPGKKYQVPGQLVPGEELFRNGLEYVEVGPLGWEELIVIVTDEPIISTQDLFPSNASSPFVALSPERIELLLEQLADMQADSFACGVLGFLVE